MMDQMDQMEQYDYGGEDMQESPEMEDYGEEGEEAMEDVQGESYQKQNTHPYPKPYNHEDNAALEQRLEQIKHNIKSHNSKHLQSQQNPDSLAMSVNEHDEIMRHREKLASIQESQNKRRAEMVQSNYTYNNETPFNGEKSKEMIEFELSEASPVRKS